MAAEKKLTASQRRAAKLRTQAKPLGRRAKRGEWQFGKGLGGRRYQI
jgi:hypothetical protein